MGTKYSKEFKTEAIRLSEREGTAAGIYGAYKNKSEQKVQHMRGTLRLENLMESKKWTVMCKVQLRIINLRGNPGEKTEKPVNP